MLQEIEIADICHLRLRVVEIIKHYESSDSMYKVDDLLDLLTCSDEHLLEVSSHLIQRDNEIENCFSEEQRTLDNFEYYSMFDDFMTSQSTLENIVYHYLHNSI